MTLTSIKGNLIAVILLLQSIAINCHGGDAEGLSAALGSTNNEIFINLNLNVSKNNIPTNLWIFIRDRGLNELHRRDIDAVLGRPITVASCVTTPLVLGQSSELVAEIRKSLKETYEATYSLTASNSLIVIYKIEGQNRKDDEVISLEERMKQPLSDRNQFPRND